MTSGSNGGNDGGGRRGVDDKQRDETLDNIYDEARGV